MPKQVLFLCTANSCRSQIAEALVNARFGDAWQAHSAGVRPAGVVHPLALQALAEIGIQHQGVPKDIDAVRAIAFDRVITVCDAAAEECPIWLGDGRRIHHSFPDPARATGSPEEILQAFRQVRDQILHALPELLL